MSASDKKKLRKEQNAAAMTERQLAAAKEAKQLKIYTITFVVVLALIVGIALGVVVAKTIENSGIREKNTIAATIGDHELTSAQLNYYFVDAVNNFYNTLYESYTSSASLYGLLLYGIDFTKPLDEQTYDKETGETWADYFVNQAMVSAKSAYALYDHAVTSGHKLTEEEQKAVNTTISNMELYGTFYGYSKLEDYLRAMYGNGSDETTFREYIEVNTMVNSYYSAHMDTLEYDEEDFREYEKDKYNDYTWYTYAYYYISADKFLPEKETESDKDSTSATKETVTYTDEEREQALADAKAVAESLVNGAPKDLDAFDKAIQGLDINKDVKNAASTKMEENFYGSVNSLYQEWISSEDREFGDMEIVPYVVKNQGEDGKTVEVTNGYYVVFYQESNDNTFALPNVRHILIKFESATDKTTYTDEEKAVAKAEAEEIYNTWLAGDATEESFAELAKKHSDDNAEDGGLYEELIPGYTVENFDNWIYDEDRKAGDSEVISTEYGYHVMYYVGDSETSYRDYMINIDLINDAMLEWETDIVEKVTATELNTKYLNRDLVLASG